MLSSRPSTAATYDTISGKATVFKHFQQQITSTAREVLKDNEGWSNKTDAAEKRLVAQDKVERLYTKERGLADFRAFYTGTSIQTRKNQKCIEQGSFFGKSPQGTFNVDEEKPYSHEFRDWKSSPIFYN